MVSVPVPSQRIGCCLGQTGDKWWGLYREQGLWKRVPVQNSCPPVAKMGKEGLFGALVQGCQEAAGPSREVAAAGAASGFLLGSPFPMLSLNASSGNPLHAKDQRSQSCEKISPNVHRARGASQLAECLPSMHNALGSVHTPVSLALQDQKFKAILGYIVI